jgi:hypothetical protein
MSPRQCGLLAAVAINNAKGDPAELEAARVKTCSLIKHNPALVVPKEVCQPPAVASSQ